MERFQEVLSQSGQGDKGRWYKEQEGEKEEGGGRRKVGRVTVVINRGTKEEGEVREGR